MSLFYVANPLEAKTQKAPEWEPLSHNGRCLFGSHARFDIRQGAIDTRQYPLLAHQRHHGVRDARGTDPYRRSELLGSHTRFDVRQGAIDTRQPTNAITASAMPGGLTRTGALNYSAAIRASMYARARSMRASTRSLPTNAITASMAGD